MTTMGAYTKGVARLSEHGTAELDADGAIKSVSADIYEAWLGYGIRATSANVSNLPAVNSVHPDYGNVIVSGYRFSLVGPGNGVWHIAVDYDRGEPGGTAGSGNEDRVTSRSWDSTENTLDLISDVISGEPVLNSAGDPFDSIPQIPRIAPRVSISFLTNTAPTTYSAANGTVNNADITIMGQTFPAFTAMARFSISDRMVSSGKRYEVRAEFEGRINLVNTPSGPVNAGWREVFIECGYNFVDGGTRYKFTEKVKAADGGEEEKEVSSPQLLTADGGDGRGKTPVLKIVNAHPVASWSGLNIPA